MPLARQRKDLAEKYAGHCDTTYHREFSCLLPFKNAGVRWASASQTPVDSLPLPRSYDFLPSRAWRNKCPLSATGLMVVSLQQLKPGQHFPLLYRLEQFHGQGAVASEH